jgi:hypothetical protein
MTEPRIADHKCSFPVQPPHFITRPGPCVTCGKTYVRAEAERQIAEARAVLDALDAQEGTPDD